MKRRIAFALVLVASVGALALAPAAGQRAGVGPVPNIGQIGGLTKGRGQARYCRGIGFIDLGSAVDGASYYFRRSDGQIIGACGGACWRQDQRDRCRRECPPAGWTCRSPIPG
jgi:hypothetical protein